MHARLPHHCLTLILTVTRLIARLLVLVCGHTTVVFSCDEPLTSTNLSNLCRIQARMLRCHILGASASSNRNTNPICHSDSDRTPNITSDTSPFSAHIRTHTHIHAHIHTYRYTHTHIHTELSFGIVFSHILGYITLLLYTFACLHTVMLSHTYIPVYTKYCLYYNSPPAYCIITHTSQYCVSACMVKRFPFMGVVYKLFFILSRTITCVQNTDTTM